MFLTQTRKFQSWPRKIYSMASQGKEAPCFIWTILYCWPHKKNLLRQKSILHYFFLFNQSWLQKISLLSWKFDRHIDILIDFINLGLAKLLRPQDAVRALYVGLASIRISQEIRCLPYANQKKTGYPYW